MIPILTRVQQKLHRVLGKLGGGRTTGRRSQLNRLSQHTVAGLEQRTLLTNYADYVTTFETTLEETLPPVGTNGWFDGIAKYPKHGTLTPLPGGSFRYEPDDGYAGPDYFEYKFHEYIDYGEGTPTENDFILPVGIVVYLPPPEAYDDSTYDWEDPETGIVYQDVNYFVLEGNALSIPREDGVLKNDIDWRSEDNWDTLTAIQKTGVDPLTGISYDPVYGSVSLSGDGSFSYTPFQSAFASPDFSGLTDRFYYYVRDAFNEVSGLAMVTVDLAKIFIQRDGQDVDNNLAQLTSWVGEEIALSVGIKGEAFVAAASYQWSIGGTPIDNYIESEEESEIIDGELVVTHEGFSMVIDLSSSELESPSPTFYWYKPGSMPVTVTINTPGGQTGTDTASFTIKRPDRELFSHTTGFDIWNNKISFGLLDDTTGELTSPGISFTTSSDNSAPGEYRYTQTISDITIFGKKRSDGTYNKAMNYQAGLDNQISYGDPQDSPYYIPPEFSDYAEREFHANLYLMYRSSRANSIWVPIHDVEWGFEWVATKDSNGVWSFSRSSFYVRSNQGNSEFPNWTRVVHNGSGDFTILED